MAFWGTQGFSNVPWHKCAFWPGTRDVFFRIIFGNSLCLVYGEGGAPIAVPVHKLRVASHVRPRPVPKYVSFELSLGILRGSGEGRGGAPVRQLQTGGMLTKG